MTVLIYLSIIYYSSIVYFPYSSTINGLGICNTDRDMNKLVINMTKHRTNTYYMTQNKTDKTLQYQPELSEVIAVQGEQDFTESTISLDLEWYLSEARQEC